jgi:predicted DNA-binding transcriptional regulator YafY
MADIKLKCLRVLDILNETDIDHPLTTAQISEKLALFDLAAERKAISRDIAVLNEAGYQIRPCPDNKRGYYRATRRFENWEIKVLIDAIVSAKFLTDRDIQAITAKLQGMASRDSAKLLTRVTPVNRQRKPDNLFVKASIDYLLEAIRTHKKVQFQYQYTDADMKKQLRKDGYFYVVNPYALTWKDEHYYLIGNLDKYDNLGYYRLDRMINMTILAQPVKDATVLLGENPAQRIDEYVSTAIYCHSGARINLQLLCQYGLEDEIIDYFGTDHYHAKQPDGFECHVRVMHSKGLIHWLMQHGDKVKVLAPEAVKDELIASLQATLARYQPAQPSTAGEGQNHG